MKEQTATLANGCFWCTEAVFKRIKGIISVLPGYTGGKRENPSYQQVSTGATGHAEAIQVKFDADTISYDTILDIFFATHNPTTLNQQGADIGTQYRSAIFYHNPEQKQAAENKIQELTESKKYESPIVTEVTAYSIFYPAEDYHFDFYDRNQNYPYCRVVIDPKIKKLMQEFAPVINQST